MTVRELRNIIVKYKEDAACDFNRLLHKQRLGYTYKEVFKSLPNVMNTIVANALLKANQPLLETDGIRIPEWIDNSTFLSFIAKLQKS